MTKKIGIFTGYYLPHLGGVERYVDKLSGALLKLGYEIVVVTSNHDELPPYEIIDNRKVYRLPIQAFAKNRYPIPKVNREYRELIHAIEAEKIDYYLLNTRFHLTSLVGAKMGRRFGRPTMLIDHGTGHFTVNSPLLDYFGKFYEHVLTAVVKRYVDKFYGVSKACNTWLEHFSIHASGVLYNSIDPADKKVSKLHYNDEYPSDQTVIAYAGRLIKEKGILNLLDAFVRLNQERPQLKLKLAIAGDGDLLEKIKRDYNDQDIYLLGRIDFEHVKALMKRSDVFVYPSLYPEGLPTSILEAGLLGCAVVATPRGGTEEVIIDNQHGIITDGSTSGLYQALNQLVANPVKRKELATTLQARVERYFNWDVVAKQVDKEIKSFNVE